MIIISKPVYNGDDPKNRMIGIAEYRLLNEGQIVQIKNNKKLKTGQFVYPNIYEMSKHEISKYPRDTVGHNKVVCYMVPIRELKIRSAIMNPCPVTVVCPMANITRAGSNCLIKGDDPEIKQAVMF